MSYPAPPEKIVAFNSGAVQPWDIGRQFDEHARAMKAIIEFLKLVVRDDGALKNSSIGPEQLSPDLATELAQAATLELNELLTQTRANAAEAVAAKYDAITLRNQIDARLRAAQTQVNNLELENTALHAEVASLRDQVSAASAGFAGLGGVGVLPRLAGGADTITLSDINRQMTVLDGSDAGAEAWASVSMEWAEHLPDPIPPNILATNAITGEHWSSRWWAIKAQGAFGMQALWFQGSYPDPGPPTTPLTPTGDPIQPGAMYWNTDHNQMMVWDGTAWTALGVPAAATSSSLFYEATDGQTTFATTDTDIAGRNFQLRADGSNGVNVFLNGIRLTLTRDYAVDAPSSTVTLAYPAVAGSILALDVLVPQSDIAPGGVAIHKCKTLAMFDGVTLTFELETLDGATLVLGGANELSVVLDGVPQEPGVDFSATTDTISFAVAPRADAKSFILWFTPVSEPVVESAP